jgi:maleate isomerase
MDTLQGDLGLGCRVAVATPSANPAVEPEIHHLLPAGVALYTTRFPVMPGTTLMERNAAYLTFYAKAHEAFGALAPKALLLALTGPSYRLLGGEDEAMCSRISETAGMPVATSSVTIREAVRVLSVGSISLVSPYPAELTAMAVGYWEDAGIKVVEVVKVTEEFRAYELRTDEVFEALGKVKSPKADATVMSGTGMISIPAITRARQTMNKPILSSNLCGGWWLTAKAGQQASTALAKAAPELAKRL